MDRKTGTIMIVAAGILWGSMSIFVNALTALGMTSMQISVSRSLFTPFLLIPILYKMDKKLIAIAPRDWYYFLGTGIFSLLFFNWCYFNAIKASSASVAAVLLYTAPIFVVLMSAALFGEKLTKKKLAALAVTFIGCVLVSGVLSQGQSIGTKALLMGLGSGFGYSLYSIFGRYALAKYHSLTVTLYTIMFCAVGSLILSAAETGVLLPAQLFTAKGLVIAVLMSVVTCAAPYVLYTSGLRYVESGRASIYATVEPAVATIISVTVFSEQLTLTKISGMLMIFLSVVILAKEK
ncbi:MAG: EamA family transporter [Oscillospiraceae bacterium]|nr:EamA family transporter [Oscillospiraceae bacterium]